PLPISQRVEKSPLGLIGSYVECGIKRAARSDDPQVLVEDQDGLSNRVHNGVSESAGIRDSGKLRPEIGQRHEDLPSPKLWIVREWTPRKNGQSNYKGYAVAILFNIDHLPPECRAATSVCDLGKRSMPDRPRATLFAGKFVVQGSTTTRNQEFAARPDGPDCRRDLAGAIAEQIAAAP